MSKIQVLTIAVCVLASLSLGMRAFSNSKGAALLEATAPEAMAVESATAVRSAPFLQTDEQSGALSAARMSVKESAEDMEKMVGFDEAFDIEKGETVVFGGTEISFVDLSVPPGCLDSSCARAVVLVAGEETRLRTGEIYYGTHVRFKLSQIAPQMIDPAVTPRIVLLVAGVATP